MTLQELFISAKKRNQDALEKLYIQFQYFVRKKSKLGGRFDEDLYQDFCEILIQCIYTFPM